MAMSDRNDIADQVKENFQLKTLQERVWRLEAENKDLKVRNSILDTQYQSQCEMQFEMFRTLHANLEENICKMEDAEKQIERLQKELEDQKQEHKDKLEEERKLWEHKVENLNVKNEFLDSELQKVAEFREKRTQMESDLASLEQQLKDQEEAHAEKLSEKDRETTCKLDEREKEIKARIKEMREVDKARTKEHLDWTTKKTILENENLAADIHFHNKQTERLYDRNQDLMEENAQLRRKIQIHKDLETELAKRTQRQQKIINRVRQRQLDSTSTEQSRDILLSDSFNQELSSPSAGASRELSVATEENSQLKRQAESLTSRLQTVHNEFAQYRRDHATLTQLEDQSTRLIIAALYELKNQRECNPFPPSSYNENANWQFTNMTARQKEYFFRVLLEKLNSSMCGTCFPTGGHPGPHSSTGSLPQIQKNSVDQGHFSQFLWSVATHGAPPSAHGRKEVSHKGSQTETDPSDPCLKEGLWNPRSRALHGSPSCVTPAIVCGTVRPWGSKAVTHKQRAGRVV